MGSRSHGLSRSIRLVAGLSLLATICVLPRVVRAAPPQQEGERLTYGATVTGEITEAVPCVRYWFDGAAGDRITLDMQRTSGSLDGQLWLYRQAGTGDMAVPLAFNDDRPSGGLNPLIEYTLPATDWYTVDACRLQHENMRVTVGTYELTLTGPAGVGEAAGAAPQVPTAPGTATPGAGLTSDLFPAATATGEPAAGIEPPTPPTSLTEGLFPIQPTAGGPSPTPAADGFIRLDPNETVEARLAAGEGEHVYRLDAAAGLLAVDWTQPDPVLAPRVWVTTLDGALLALAGTPDPVGRLSVALFVPEDTALLVHVGRFEPSADGEAGDYTLRVGLGE